LLQYKVTNFYIIKIKQSPTAIKIHPLELDKSQISSLKAMSKDLQGGLDSINATLEQVNNSTKRKMEESSRKFQKYTATKIRRSNTGNSKKE
jgi:hypothetical protein